jgi:TolA-binding protein
MVLLSYQGLSRWKTIKSLDDSIRRKVEANEALQPELAIVRQLQTQVATYKTNLAFLDSMIVDPGKWSRLFSSLTKNFQSVNRIWVESIVSDPQGFTMVGKATSRDRVPRLAEEFPDVNLKRVTRVVSDDGETTYEFELTASIPRPDTTAIPNLTQPEGDRLAASGGSIEAGSVAGTPEATPQPTSAPINEEPPEVRPEPKQEEPIAQKVVEPTAAPQVQEEKSAVNPEPEFVPYPEPLVLAPKVEKAPQQPVKAAPAAEIRTTKVEIPSQDRYNEGLALIRKGDPEKAMGVFRSLIEKYPSTPEIGPAHYWLGECLFAAGEYDAAISEFQAALACRNNLKREATHLMLGQAYMHIQQNEAARNEFQTLLQESPNGQFSLRARTHLEQLSR